MAPFRRGRWWWTDFTVNGQRFRQPLKTTDWREAERNEKVLISQASAGKLAPTSQQFARLAFGEAADRYLADRESHLAARSVATEKQRLKPLRGYFRAITLTKITADAILAYIPERKRAGAANRTINMELGALRRILKKAKRWYLVADEIKPLPERRDVGRALAHEEKVRMLKLAASRPEWQTAYLAAVLALNTTMRSCEIRGLRWRDVDLMELTITVHRSKTEAGERVIPLNDAAKAAVLTLRDRAKTSFGEIIASDWYVFPHAEGNTAPDATQPMSGWRTAWRALTRSVICPECGVIQLPAQSCRNEKCKADIHTLSSPLAGLRFHDLRHHAITELAESESVSEQTIMAIAGHVTTRMLRHYSHVRREAMRRAVESLDRKSAAGSQTGGNDTKHGTKLPADGTAPPQVLENVVDVAGIEPATPCLQSRCSPS